MKYGITGATGGLGQFVIEHLLKLGISSSSIVAFVRDEEKAAGLKSSGIELRVSHYNDEKDFANKLKGIDTLLLISSNSVGTRADEHKNVIRAAVSAGVERIVYTSIANASKFDLPIAHEHKETEEFIKASKLNFTIIRNNWYLENYKGDILGASEHGAITTAVVSGKVGSALKTEYAEAAARILISKDFVNQTLELGGSLWNFKEFAETLGKIIGKSLKLNIISIDDKVKMLEGFGIPNFFAQFYASLDAAIDEKLLEIHTGDFEKVLGRKPLSLAEGMKKILS